MSRYLINITVGPVQGFIASARKLRDLWYGSYLLSELSKSVARSLQEQKCELVFPAVDPGTDVLQEESGLNVANKIMALSPEGTEPGEIIKEAEKAFKEHWRKTSEIALEETANKVIDREMFKQQVADFGEFYAAWVEYDKEHYSACRERCDKLLAGRKLLRNFEAPGWDGTGKPKSSLDGIYERVFSQKNSESYLVKKGEELDALGIVKRFCPLTKSIRRQFDSLPQVAAQPFLEGLKKAARESKKVAEIIGHLPKVEILYPNKEDRPRGTKTPWDGWPEELSSEILFPSVVEAEIRLRKDDERAKKVWVALQKQMKELWSKTKEPLPYCCLLVGDGDDMGNTLKKLTIIEQHQKFSKELAGFADRVHDLLKQYQGRVVYSGGDDLMAYVPLHTAIACARAVNEAFTGAMTRACQKTNISTPPTFSMGMAIVHLHKPLHQILELARKAEKISKNQPGKNSLTLIQSKRGGTDITVTGKWHENSTMTPLTEQLINFAEQYRKGKLPSRLGYQLRAITKECGEQIKWDLQHPENVCAAEALRVVRRKQQKDGRKLSSGEAADILAGHQNLRELSDRLIISHLISRTTKLADCKKNAHQKGGMS